MAYLESSIIGMNESDKAYSVSNVYGDYGGNGQATGDDEIWGDKLNIENKKLQFSKTYLNLTFEIRRSRLLEFLAVSKGKVSIFGRNGKSCDFIYNTLGNGMYTSQTNDTATTTKSDITVLVRVRIPTKQIYNIGKIEKIYCWVELDGGKSTIDQTWNLNDGSVSIYDGYYWYTEPGFLLYRDYFSRGTAYSYNSVGPKLAYAGETRIYSSTSISGDACGEKFFTETKGQINLQMTGLKYFSTDEYRMPSHLFFNGKNKSGVAINNFEVPLLTANENGNYDDIINQSDIFSFFPEDVSGFSNFSKIETAYMCFGGDIDNKMLVQTFTDGFWNSDIPDNVLLSFDSTNCVNNRLKEIVEFGNTVDDDSNIAKFEVEINGKVNIPSIFPFQFETFSGTTKKARLVDKDGKENKIELRDTITVYSSYLEIKYIGEYGVKERAEKNGLDLSECPIAAGDYKLKCTIKNKLKTRLGSDSSETYTFSFVNNKSITVEQIQNKYMAFGLPEPKIKYIISSEESGTGEDIKIDVPGNILLSKENLVFSNPNSGNVRIYKTTDGTTQSEMTINDYKIGLHKNYHTTIQTTTSTTIKYTTLKSWMAYTGKDEQHIIYITYFLNELTNINIDKEIYTQPFKFALGRTTTPVFDSVRVENGTLKYYLIDNGSDRILSTNNIQGKSQNQFIANRVISPYKYFGISRDMGEDNIIKEKLRLIFTPKTGNKKEFERELTLSTLNTFPNYVFLSTFLGYLNTGTVQTFKFDDFKIDSTTEQEIKDSGTLDITIAIDYIYRPPTSPEANDEIKEQIWSINFSDVNFSLDKIPLGLRKDGVIINPKEEQDLNPDNATSGTRKNTFLINVSEVKKEQNKYIPTNGIRIEFQTGEQNVTLPFFDIYLNEDGEICFASKDGIFKPTFS